MMMNRIRQSESDETLFLAHFHLNWKSFFWRQCASHQHRLHTSTHTTRTLAHAVSWFISFEGNSSLALCYGHTNVGRNAMKILCKIVRMQNFLGFEMRIPVQKFHGNPSAIVLLPSHHQLEANKETKRHSVAMTIMWWVDNWKEMVIGFDSHPFAFSRFISCIKYETLEQTVETQTASIWSVGEIEHLLCVELVMQYEK